MVTLESTGEVAMDPPPARVWRGLSADGVEIVALVTIMAGQSGDADVDARTQWALETRVTSTALVMIPEPR